MTPDDRKEGPDIPFTLKWIDKAVENCLKTGRRDAAELWKDARLIICSLRDSLNVALADVETAKIQGREWMRQIEEEKKVLRARAEMAGKMEVELRHIIDFGYLNGDNTEWMKVAKLLAAWDQIQKDKT